MAWAVRQGPRMHVRGLLLLAVAGCSAAAGPGNGSVPMGPSGKADQYGDVPSARVGDPCPDPGRTICASPFEVGACGDSGTLLSAEACSENTVCGFDFAAGGFGCVPATEHCDKPGENICASALDVAICTESGLVEPGPACLVNNQVCGWNDAFGRIGCVDERPACGLLDEACCAGTSCGVALTCYDGVCVSASPGCGGNGEPCCGGATCQTGLVCSAGTCVPWG
jgi:hypothetical protein